MNYIANILNDIKNLPENKICSDCNIQESTYVSINNGVFLCYQCADFHSVFGIQVSFLKNLYDEFDEYLILYLIRGGNLRFRNFLKENNMDHFSEVNDKIYFSKAMDYYRQNLKSEVIGEEPPEKYQQQEVQDLIPKEEIAMVFPEFEEYYVEINDDKPKGIVDKAKDVFDNAFYTTLHYKEVAKNNIQKSGIIEKVKEGSKVSYENLKIFGKNIFEKSRPLLKNIKNKAKEGFINVKDKTKNFFDKIFKKENEEKIQVPEGQSNYYKLKIERENVSDVERFINNEQKFEPSLLNELENKELSKMNSIYSNNNEIKYMNNLSLKESEMSELDKKFQQNNSDFKSFQIFGESTYEPQVPYPFLNEIQEHENMPKIFTNQGLQNNTEIISIDDLKEK